MAGVEAYLNTRTDCLLWRNNSGGTRIDDFFMKFGKKGSGDWLGLQAVQLHPASTGWLVGRFVAIECKRERGGTQSDDQARFQRNIERHGGLYILARSVEDVAKGMGPCTVHIVKERRPRVIPR